MNPELKVLYNLYIKKGGSGCVNQELQVLYNLKKKRGE